MRYLYSITVAVAVLTYTGLCWLKPIQEDAIKKLHEESLVDQYRQAKESCSKAAGINVTPLLDIEGAVYCLSTAGKLVATITAANHD